MVMDSRVGIDIKVKIDDGPVAIVDPPIRDQEFGHGPCTMAMATIDTPVTQMCEEHTKLEYWKA